MKTMLYFTLAVIAVVFGTFLHGAICDLIADDMTSQETVIPQQYQG